ncbi:MAG: AEC family transporter [Planctomycetota bacterium]
MDEWLRVLWASLAVFGVVGVGAWLRRINWLNADADASLLKLVVNVLMPCLILRSVVGNAALDQASNVWLPPVVGFGTTAGAILLCATLAWWLGPALGLRSAATRRTFAVAAGMHNYGYLPVPLAQSLYDSPDGGTNPVLGVLFVNNVGVDLAMWTVGVAVISGATGMRGWKRAINAPSIALVAALGLHLGGAGEWLPTRAGFVWQAVGMLAACAVPVALLLIGATIVDAFTQLRYSAGRSPGEAQPAVEAARPRGRGVWPMVTVACVVRLAVLPAGLATLAWVLPSAGATVEMQRVLLLHAAMPAAVFPIVLARHYGGDVRTAATIALATSALSLLTMPAWLTLGPGLIGL